jgi:hypothetical protein
MNVQSVIYAQDHLEDLRRDAAKSRMLKALPRTTLRQRLASLAGNVRTAFAAPTSTPGSVITAAH